jgi:hypothetical protein
MEADWWVEVGADLPTIVVPWEGFVDLRRNPLLINKIEEAVITPELAQALTRLNQKSSPVFTSKCDFWLLSAEEIDPLEFDAEREEVEQGISCYIDIIVGNTQLFSSFQAHETWVRSVTQEIRQAKLRQARVEFVIRAANVAGCEGYAVTLYVASCGDTETVARSVFHTALETAVTITMKLAATTGE